MLFTCRKPTTLWKRWKPILNQSKLLLIFSMSETHYSLKEMETCDSFHSNHLLLEFVGNPLLSERDGNFCFRISQSYKWKLVGNPLLSERDGNQINRHLHQNHLASVGNPLLSERDGNKKGSQAAPRSIVILSETHYSLKEMETFQALPKLFQYFFSRKPTTLWKRWKLISLSNLW